MFIPTTRRSQAGFSLVDLTMAVACVLFLSTMGIFAYSEISSDAQPGLFGISAEAAYTPASSVSLEKESPRSAKFCATQASSQSNSQADCGRF